MKNLLSKLPRLRKRTLSQQSSFPFRRPGGKTVKFASIVAGALILSVLTGTILTTFAMDWLSTSTESRANPFTQGQVDVEIEEPNWPGAPEQYLRRRIYPNRIIPKDPIAVHTGTVPQYLFLEVWNPMFTLSLVTPRNTPPANTTAYDRIEPAAPVQLFSFRNNNADGINTTNWVELTARARNAWLDEDGVEVESTTEGARQYRVRIFGYMAVTFPASHQSNPQRPNTFRTQPLFTHVRVANFLERGHREDEHAIPMGTEINMPLYALAIQAEHLTGETSEMTWLQRLNNAFGIFLGQEILDDPFQ
jgi:hypothetical protein